jgi:hypothetical protein
MAMTAPFSFNRRLRLCLVAYFDRRKLPGDFRDHSQELNSAAGHKTRFEQILTIHDSFASTTTQSAVLFPMLGAQQLFGHGLLTSCIDLQVVGSQRHTKPASARCCFFPCIAAQIPNSSSQCLKINDTSQMASLVGTLIWLVSIPLINMKVNGKDDIPYIMENKSHV